MKLLKENEMELTEGGKFWGTVYKPIPNTQRPVYNESGGVWLCYQDWSCVQYFFWLEFECETVEAGCDW
ncbi:MAG: hypothetical protein LBV41_13865 [Cytophagaceae bacterium]|jgi:hypothetical protein|nr:hypothetical protein [Cytophagaceae bacterium]